jgi:hypothetical protein
LQILANRSCGTSVTVSNAGPMEVGVFVCATTCGQACVLCFGCKQCVLLLQVTGFLSENYCHFFAEDGMEQAAAAAASLSDAGAARELVGGSCSPTAAPSSRPGCDLMCVEQHSPHHGLARCCGAGGARLARPHWPHLTAGCGAGGGGGCCHVWSCQVAPVCFVDVVQNLGCCARWLLLLLLLEQGCWHAGGAGQEVDL